MSKCGTCKYWDCASKRNPMSEEHPGYNVCRRVTCREITEDYDADALKKIYTFIPADYDYMPLMTRSDFGCVLHEPKD